MDAYNANPSSMMSALQNFISGKSEKRLMILGDMLELGSSSQMEHRGILDYLKDSGEMEVILVGEEFYKFAGEGNYSFNFFKDLENCMIFLKSMNLSGYTVLLKGSRKISLEKTKELLLN